MKATKRIALVAHDERKKALLRMSVLHNILTACNRATADLIISTPGFNAAYHQKLEDYGAHIRRSI